MLNAWSWVQYISHEEYMQKHGSSFEQESLGSPPYPQIKIYLWSAPQKQSYRDPKDRVYIET